MSWKTTITTGVVLGASLGAASYVTLSRIGSEMLTQSTYEAQNLPEVSGCGLDNEDACIALDGLIYAPVEDATLPVVTVTDTTQPSNEVTSLQVPEVQETVPTPVAPVPQPVRFKTDQVRVSMPKELENPMTAGRE